MKPFAADQNMFVRTLLPPQVHTVKIPKQEPGPSMSPQAWQQYFAARLHRGNTDNAALNEAQKYVRLHVPHHNYGGVTSEYVDDLLSLLPHSLQGTGLQVRTHSVLAALHVRMQLNSACCACCSRLSVHTSCFACRLTVSGRGVYVHGQQLEFP